MNERPQKIRSEEKTKKKDMYTAVLICQIVAVSMVMLVFHLTVKPNEAAYTELKHLIGEEVFTIEDIASALKDYFGAENTWEVFGDNVSFVSEEATSEEQTTQDSITEEATDSAEKGTTAETETTFTDDTAPPETETSPAEENLTGTGGDDLTLYEAAANTSFAPIKSTSPAVAPIEDGRYTSYFGYRINPITGEFSFHTGLDIAASEGTKIRAAYSGEVTRVGEDGRAGKYIFITHDDGYQTFYCHCSEILAKVGAKMRQGETIAKVGSTGWSTGPHLHFEVRKDNIRYNPLHILSK